MIDRWSFSGLLPDMLHGPSAQFEHLGQWVFFKIIFDFLDNEILVFRENMVHAMAQSVGAIALTMITLWIIMQGYRIVTGQSREPMMGLVVSSLRTVVILSAATTMTFGGTELYATLTDVLPRDITEIVTGHRQDPAQAIDHGLTKMQLAMAAIDALPSIDNPGIKEDKDRALLLTGIGVAGPAVVGGALLVMYKFAIALFVGLGPLFIFCLIFDQTKNLFSRWLYYGIGTMFSMAVLSFTVTVAMKMVGAVAANFATQYGVMMAMGGDDSPGVNTMALQQGGLGIFLTVLIVSVPPMAAGFFQGALGSFMHYSAFGANSAPSRPESPGGAASDNRPSVPQQDPRMMRGDQGTPQESGSNRPLKSQQMFTQVTP